ncbi:hypothetical protein EVAR_54369_1 [Eumeta japonica]|uniref:Uncharacterized protein n=1 Tax=Eumeta variegata TaxID=151549 RepID=A0A4C1Y2X4_EUMVA|nr:hypothetical protein EVAR_54369_1 [Eumeta japonica]
MGRPVEYHTVTEYGREVAAFAVAVRPVTESFGRSLPLSSFHRADLPPLDIPIPSQGAGDALMTLLKLRLSIGGTELSVREHNSHLTGFLKPAPTMSRRSHNERAHAA